MPPRACACGSPTFRFPPQAIAAHVWTPEEVHEEWCLERSIWAPRKAWCDSKAFVEACLSTRHLQHEEKARRLQKEKEEEEAWLKKWREGLVEADRVEAEKVAKHKAHEHDVKYVLDEQVELKKKRYRAREERMKKEAEEEMAEWKVAVEAGAMSTSDGTPQWTGRGDSSTVGPRACGAVVRRQPHRRIPTSLHLAPPAHPLSGPSESPRSHCMLANLLVCYRLLFVTCPMYYKNLIEALWSWLGYFLEYGGIGASVSTHGPVFGHTTFTITARGII